MIFEGTAGRGRNMVTIVVDDLVVRAEPRLTGYAVIERGRGSSQTIAVFPAYVDRPSGALGLCFVPPMEAAVAFARSVLSTRLKSAR